jgi:PAS domain S-box-containing protein
MPYQAYFNSASEGLIIVDREGRIVDLNAACERMLAYSRDELIGQPIELLVPERSRRQHCSHRQDFFRAPRSRPMGIGLNLAARRKDGSEFPVEVSLTYTEEMVRGGLVVAALTDITERLALEREARRAETLASLGTMAVGIAHDLNNPLSVILARAELLLATPPEALGRAQIEDDLVVIRRQAERAARIVEQFLELARAGSRSPAPLNLNHLVERVLLLFGEQLRKGGIDVRADLDWGLPAVLGDAVALERVLINLLSNARDAIAGQGTVRITTRFAHEPSGWLCLSVADDGDGIEAAALPKIFDLLYTTKPGGSGLGLWLSRRIVQEHNGMLEADSDVGGGTTFTIKLPPIEVAAHP